MKGITSAQMAQYYRLAGKFREKQLIMTNEEAVKWARDNGWNDDRIDALMDYRQRVLPDG